MISERLTYASFTIVFQDCPNVLLPSALKDENPLAIERSVNGQMTKKAI